MRNIGSLNNNAMFKGKGEGGGGGRQEELLELSPLYLKLNRLRPDTFCAGPF